MGGTFGRRRVLGYAGVLPAVGLASALPAGAASADPGPQAGAAAPDALTPAATTTGAAVVNVRDYGAVGDGTTDDTAALQRAIDASTAGATVFFPTGTYVVSAPVRFLGGRAYRGDGHGMAKTAVIRQRAGANLGAGAAPGTITGLFVAAGWYSGATTCDEPVWIDNLTFDGNAAANPSSIAGGVVVMNYHSTVSACHLVAMPGFGLLLTDVTRAGAPITNSASENRVLGNRIEGCGGHGIWQVCRTTIANQDGYCEDNVVTKVGGDMLHFERASGWLLRRNHGYDIAGNGMWLDNCYATVITENEVEDFGNENRPGTFYQGIQVRQLDDRGTIIAHNFVSCREPAGNAAFELVAVTTGSDQRDAHVIVTDNLIKGKGGTASRGLVAATGPGGQLDAVISGNQIVGVRSPWVLGERVAIGRQELGRLDVAGELTVGAHLSGGGTRTPVVTLLGGLGRNAPGAAIAGNDVRGHVSFGTGTKPVAGDAVAVAFAVPYATTPIVTITPANRATAARRPYVAAASPTGFSIGFDAAPPASAVAGALDLAYHVIG